MKIKKETLAKSANYADSEGKYQKCSTNLAEHDSRTPILLDEGVQTNQSIVVTSNSEKEISEVTSAIKIQSSTISESWHQAGILRQALLSTNPSGPMEKRSPNIHVDAVMPKIRDSLISTVGDIKLPEILPPVSVTVSINSISQASFCPASAFSTPMTSLPSSPFPSLSFGAISASSLSSNCAVPPSDVALSIITPIQNCEHQTRLSSPPNDILSNTSADAVPNPDADSSVSVASVDSISSSLVSAVSSYSTPPSNVCQAFASLSKDDGVTVVYSSIPKVEPSVPRLMHDIQKNVPLPSMSEVKSSLTNHLSVLPSPQKSSNNDLCSKVTETLSALSSNTDTHNQAISFNNVSTNAVGGSLGTIKLDEQPNSSDFDGESTISLSSGTVKFSNGNGTDIASSIVIPVSSDVILTKIDGHNSTTHQDISHIITIPLPSCTIYNSSLSIPVPLPICNGTSSGTSVQMTPTVVSNLPYSITGISNQASNSCWPSSAVALNVTSASNSQISTCVTTSLPVSIMSVAPSMPSLPNNNMIHFTSNSISLPTSSQVASTSINTTSQDPVCYTVQSPTEILSQLSKGGILPAMSSGQVSSVLSALGADSHVDMESDTNTNYNEILNSQVLPGDKVSTVTQTDSLELNIMQHEEKLIQLLSSQQLLEHQVNGSQLLMSTGNQTQILNTDSTLTSSELVTDDITEPKQIPSPFPRIVAMVLNTPAICSDKLSICDGNVEALLKNGELSSPSGMGSHTDHPTDIPGDSLHDFLVLPSNSKPQPKRVKRNSALRDMLLGLSEPSVRRETPNKKPRGRPKKTRTDTCVNVSAADVKNDKSLDDVNRLGDSDVNTCSFTKEVGCYKCKCCPFLSVEESSMMLHVKQKHCSETQGKNISRPQLKCPGCPNVFYTTNSLEVHLKQDHQVSTPELKAITSSALKVATEGKVNNAPIKKKKKKISNGIGNNVKKTSDPNNEDVPQIMTGLPNNDMLEIPDSVKLSVNCNDSEIITNDRKLRIKSLENDNSGNKSTFSFKNISFNSGSKKDGENSLTQEQLEIVPEKKNLASNDNDSEVNSVKNIMENAAESTIDGKVCVVEQKRKRGRPKGSRSSLITGLKSTEKDSTWSPKKTNLGHRCNVDNCAVAMRSLENIEYHRACHSGAEYRCPECSHTHCHWNGMSTHLWRVHMVDMELYTCDQCSYKTVSYAKLINLHKWIHGSERPFLCDSCGKGFKNRKQLRNHKAIHQPKQTKIGECEICGRTFTNTRMLRMHLDNVHNKLRPHLCNYCGYSASSVSSLKMHMRKHTGEKPFRCHLCDYCTADHNSLRRHKMRHTGDKPYKCPHCPYACIQSSTYKAHLKTKHPGMDDGLMFSCSICSFRSVKEENYLAHLAEHKTDTSSFPEKRDRYKQGKLNGKFDLEDQSDSVIHLIECDLADDNSGCYSIVKLRNMDSSSDVQMTLESDFESEEITGDISEAELITGDIGEPQEFKVCESDMKMKSP